MSTLESLVLANSGQHQKRFGEKLFSHYDEVDYSRKSTRELQSQMQTHLSLLRASQEEYEHKFKTSWSPPLNYNHEKIKQFLSDAKQNFIQAQNNSSLMLTKDLEMILSGHRRKLFIDQNDLKMDYSQTERKEHERQFFYQVENAGRRMEHQRDIIEGRNYRNKEELEAVLNEGEKVYIVVEAN
jgi:hypothetical protein